MTHAGGSDLTQGHAFADLAVRQALSDGINMIYGAVAPAPSGLRCTLLHRAVVARWHGATLDTLRVAWGDATPDGFTMQLMRPNSQQACPVIVTGDACWAYLVDEVIVHGAAHGVALAWFNRTEVAADPPPEDAAAIAAAVAASDGAEISRVTHPPIAAIAAWAWALSRAVDALLLQPGIDSRRIAVAGHSRGGKAALLAGALDARIALTAANNAGTLGSASSFVMGDGAETVVELVQRFPHWVGPKLRKAVARGEPVTMDQHTLLQAIAPRALLITQASDDLWANPKGARHTVQRAREVYEQLGAADAFSAVWRIGGHAQTVDDWLAVVRALRDHT